MKFLRRFSSQVSDLIHTDTVIVGGGVVGCAIGHILNQSQRYDQHNMILIEKNETIGMETSSRNSEVIHAGIYYEKDSNKERMCLRGKELLYQYCKQNKVNYNQIGKWIVAQNEPEQIDYLKKLKEKSQDLGINLKYISETEISQKEPNIKAKLGLISETTGIIDSHEYIHSLLFNYMKSSQQIFLNDTEVLDVMKTNNNYGYLVKILHLKINQVVLIKCNNVINCAGLQADKIGNLLNELVDEKEEKFEYTYCKGNYFSYSEKVANRLIYPIPDKKLTSLGTHLTLDLNGKTKFGPDVEYLSNRNINYQVNEERRNTFFNAASQYVLNLKEEKLLPDYSGIRPKLSISTDNDNNKIQDFYMKQLNTQNRGNLINLIGIESPGLTSSLAIAEWVKNKLI
ncbi:FAD dependent oxidoreductase [Neoconidiobolus thromboides FSU 785]|nr:FAD dependent oxidoreductase [Neoconidiobolus thromboides FSU 785]